MRHSSSLLASLEGMSRTTFLIARELSQNSRSGLTPRFLARKLEVSQEEVEYLVDVHHRLLYTDLTRIRLAPEGLHLVKRISEGLESHGDAVAMQRHVRGLSDREMQTLEENLGLEGGGSKKEMADRALERLYKHPDSVLHHVAGSEYSTRAREVFDSLWQSKDGILTMSQLYALHGKSEFELERALMELLQGCVAFELFRFDSEQRLVRAIALLKEIRDYKRTATLEEKGAPALLRPIRGEMESLQNEGLRFSETLCRLTAAIAAHPARLRNDGELFQEDKRRLELIATEEDEPSLNTCLWAAEGLGWLSRVDNVLCARDVNAILELDRLDRHRLLYQWLSTQSDLAPLRGLMEKVCEELKPGAWYNLLLFVNYARALVNRSDLPRLRHMGAHYEYVAPGGGNRAELRLARAIEETFCWLGVAERGYCEGDPCFRITPLGHALLSDDIPRELREAYPAWTGSIVVQPNYEIVASRDDLDPLLTVPLDTFASAVSESPVTVYKLTRERFVQAMQQGHQPESFISFLLNHNRGSIPENVLITLRDWCGTAKQVRLKTYHVIEAEDPLIIAELAHQRQWKKHLVPVEPYKAVRYQTISKAELKRALEKEGYVVN